MHDYEDNPFVRRDWIVFFHVSSVFSVVRVARLSGVPYFKRAFKCLNLKSLVYGLL